MSYTQEDFNPLKDNVVVKVPLVKDKTPGGIIKTDAMKEKEIKERALNLYFEVIAVGPDVKRVEVGMRVLSVRPPMDVPDVESEDEEYKIAFVPEYAVEGYV